MHVAQSNGAGLWELTGLQPYVQLVAENATYPPPPKGGW
jgi:hypothetical protein